jgi:hypothetical protein
VRLFVNFFQPSFKLIGRQRDGAHVRKSYSAPVTPHQRLQPIHIPPMQFGPDCGKSAPAWIGSRCCATFGLRSNVWPYLADVKSADDSTTAAADRPVPRQLANGLERGLLSTDGPADPQSEAVVVALIRSFSRPLSCWTGSGQSRCKPAPSS